MMKVGARDDYKCSRAITGPYSKKCTTHFITSTANALILETIQRTTAFARSNETEFINLIHKTSALRQSESAKSNKKQIAKNEKRIAELDGLFRKTYENFAAGRLTGKRFELLSGGYETEQAELELQTAKLKRTGAVWIRHFRADQFMELVKRYSVFRTDPCDASWICEKVVHEGDKSSGVRQQRVDIYLNYIGQFDLREDEGVTPEDPKKAKEREYQREYKRRKRAEQKAREESQKRKIA